jgi:hypothetical protein
MHNPQTHSSQLHGLAKRVGAVVFATLIFSAVASSALAAPPNLILSDGNLRAYDSMTVAEIQAYLNTQPGPLKTLVTSDYDKVITATPGNVNVNKTPDVGEAKKPASQIIWEACQQWKISPKVMLTMLQKEQSLLTRTSLTSTTLARAIGAGCSSATTNRYPGFGNQMWFGARLLDGYGEGTNGSTVKLFYPGIVVYDIYLKPNVKVVPATLATYKLYVYNPSIGGNTNFWNIHLERFGDPGSDPISGPPGAVFRFYKKSNGSHFYTQSPAEANRVQAWLYASYKYEGMSYVADPAKNSTPLYRFYNKKNGGHFYTASAVERDNVKKRFASTYLYEGIAYNVSMSPNGGATTIYRFYNKKSGGHFYTASEAERDYVTATYKAVFTYEGIAFWVLP